MWTRMGAVLKTKPHKYWSKVEEQICRYSKEQYREKGLTSSINQEILTVNYALDSYILLLIIKTRIVKFFNNMNRKRLSQKKWLAIHYNKISWTIII